MGVDVAVQEGPIDCVRVRVAVRVYDAVGLLLGVGENDCVTVSVDVGVGVTVVVTVGDTDTVADIDWVRVLLTDGVFDGVGVQLDVIDVDGEGDGLSVAEIVGVTVAVGERLCVRVADGVGVCEAKCVG